MYGTVTILDALDAEHAGAIGRALAALVDELSDASELVGAHVLATAPEELVLMTLYRSEEAAEALSARIRPQLGALVGPHLASAPRRLAGPAIFTRTRPPTDGV
jgi:hypothetical protein